MRLKLTKFILFSCIVLLLFAQCSRSRQVAKAEQKKERIELEQKRKYQKAREDFREKHRQRQSPEVRERMKEREKEAKKRMRKRKRQDFFEKLFGKSKAKN